MAGRLKHWEGILPASLFLTVVATLSLLSPAPVLGQDAGVISGVVLLDATGDPLEHASVMVVQLRRSVQSDNSGAFRITNVPAGTYSVVSHMHSLTGERQTVIVKAGEEVSIEFRLKLAPVRQEITVAASGAEETTLETFQSVATLEALDLAQKQGTSLGDVLEGEVGVARRSSGPGTTRPVVRGFDGDRVLILEDGIRTGTVSSQSGDHGEPIDPNSIEKVEVVRGPATLLYGSNAVGGVINVTSTHHAAHPHAHEGMDGYLTATGGTADARAGGAGGFEYGYKKWLFWADGGGQRAGNYSSPLGEVPNSFATIKRTTAGMGRYGDKIYVTFGYGISDGDYGVPYDVSEEEPEKVYLQYRLQHVRMALGVKDLGSWFDQFRLTLHYSDWNHQERGPSEEDSSQVVTHNEFFNKQFVYRGAFEQKKRGRWTGTVGFWGLRRDYNAVGHEANTPATTQDGFAAFALEQVHFPRVRLQFGGRLETNRYNPASLTSRTFTGFSGSSGVNVGLWEDGAFVANYVHSYRAPALEELYAFGPHAGNLTWEIGDARLKRERGDGVDLSLRHQSGKLHLEANYYYYSLGDYVYLAPTGDIDDGLVVARYAQADSRYYGVEGRLGLYLSPSLWLHLGLDSVNAELKLSQTPLPRIPPTRGRASLEWRRGNFSVEPELMLAGRQDRIFPTETETAGYASLNLRGSYTVTHNHWLQMFSVNVYNANNRLYRNHLSFVKEFAPEIGRGVQFSYTVRFF